MSDTPAKARIGDIMALASRMSGIALEELLGESRFQRVAAIRLAGYYVARKQGHPYSIIGKRVGRDHSTVIAGVRRAEEHAKRSPQYASFLKQLDKAALEADPFIPGPIVLVKQSNPRHRRPSAAKPKPIVAVEIKTACKPRNDFRTETGADGSHAFHKRIATGSALLARAIAEARAA